MTRKSKRAERAAKRFELHDRELWRAIRELEKDPKYKGMGDRQRTAEEVAAITAKMDENRDAALEAAGYSPVRDTLHSLEGDSRELDQIWRGSTELKLHIRQIGDTREFEGEFEIKGKLCLPEKPARHTGSYDIAMDEDVRNVASDMMGRFLDEA